MADPWALPLRAKPCSLVSHLKFGFPWFPCLLAGSPGNMCNICNMNMCSSAILLLHSCHALHVYHTHTPAFDCRECMTATFWFLHQHPHEGLSSITGLPIPKERCWSHRSKPIMHYSSNPLEAIIQLYSYMHVYIYMHMYMHTVCSFIAIQYSTLFY